MPTINDNFANEAIKYMGNNPILCRISLGLCSAYDATAKLTGHAINWIVKAFGTTKKVSDINLQTLDALTKIIYKNQTLPDYNSDHTFMIAEEHIISILYDQIIDREKRTDCAIVMSSAGDKTLPHRFNVDSFKANAKLRYLVVPMSVNNNMHNTVLIIDRLKEKYAYFDSFGGAIPSHALIDCKNKKVIQDNYTAIDVSKIRTSQSDYWSCGFHAIENALGFIREQVPQNKKPSGFSLRNKYLSSFEHFANTYGKTNSAVYSGILFRRQKMVLRDALENIVKNNIHSSLKQLWQELKYEILPDNANEERPLHDFIAYYLGKYPKDLDGIKVLHAANHPENAIYIHLPKNQIETAQQTADAEKKITESIKALF
jgi:hypothetical protein